MSSTNFDPKKVAALTKQLKERRTGLSKILDAKKMERDVPRTIRLIKPAPNQGGEWIYAVEVIQYWINKKPYISLDTFKEPCPITEEVEKAKLLKSAAIKELLNDWRSFSKDVSYYMPIVPVKIVTNPTTGDIMSVEYDGEEEVLKAPGSLLSDIHAIVTNPKYLAGSGGQGVFHQQLGYSIELLKSGTGKETRYTATPDPTRVPVDDAHYKPFDIMEYLNKQKKSPEELRSAIRSYLYGEMDDTADLEQEAPDVMEEDLDQLNETLEDEGDDLGLEDDLAALTDLDMLQGSLEDDLGLD